MSLFGPIHKPRPIGIHKPSGYSIAVEPCRWSTDDRPEYAAALYIGREPITGACGSCPVDATWRALRYGVARLEKA